MAWEDRTPFDAIEKQFNLSHDEVVKLMRKHLKTKSFNLWREREKKPFYFSCNEPKFIMIAALRKYFY
mgnify:CR=1 FL=1